MDILPHFRLKYTYAPIAQLDRASAFEAAGWGFKSLLVHMKLMIFTYAPAGLGHLRVTDALVESRPEKTPYILLGSIDRFMTWIHRFTSINPVGKFIFSKAQYGVTEDVFTVIYRWFLVITAGFLHKQLNDIIVRNPGKDEVWIVATHFGMAHQIGAIKQKLIRETGRTVKLIVQVTDDTSQHIWCVRGADLTFVPSKFVKEKFETYAKVRSIDFACEVIPYPISSMLTSRLRKGFGSRHKVFAEGAGTIKVAIPISGAATGLVFLSTLIKELGNLSKRFEFWVLVKKTPFTEMFMSLVAKLPRVNVLVGKNDIEMITLYELLYEKNLIHLEVTKPSEQAFKAILHPTCVGGSILLFTTPVGRQEIENVEFLERHGLLKSPGSINYSRAVKLSDNPMEGAKFILDATDSGLFSRMTAGDFRFSVESMQSGEIGNDGARQFWKKALKRLGK